MGGCAFASRNPPLHTPRMPKHVYEHVKTRCHSILREHFLCVASPIDGPAKVDFGDVDILVAWPKVVDDDDDDDDGASDQVQTIAHLLGATDVITQGRGCASNLAIPWPEELLDDCGGGCAEHPTRHIQVDVHVCQTLEALEWMLLRHAHGDIWNMIGSTIRPYGLTVDEKALWIRIPEVEELDRRRSKILLTSDPAEVLCFLGLPVADAWDRPFASLDDMYEYVALCPMFWVNPSEDGNGDGDGDARGLVGADMARRRRQGLKSNDRRRMSKRPAYRRWVDDFIPACRRRGRFLQQRTTREAVTRAALSRFHVGGEYRARRREVLLKRQRDFIFRDLIKGVVPQPSHADARATLFRGCQVKALKRIILDGDTAYGIKRDPALVGEDGFFDLDRTAEFVARRKDEIGEAAMLLHNRRCCEVMALKSAEKESHCRWQF